MLDEIIVDAAGNGVDAENVVRVGVGGCCTDVVVVVVVVVVVAG